MNKISKEKELVEKKVKLGLYLVILLFTLILPITSVVYADDDENEDNDRESDDYEDDNEREYEDDNDASESKNRYYIDFDEDDDNEREDEDIDDIEDEEEFEFEDDFNDENLDDYDARLNSYSEEIFYYDEILQNITYNDILSNNLISNNGDVVLDANNVQINREPINYSINVNTSDEINEIYANLSFLEERIAQINSNEEQIGINENITIIQSISNESVDNNKNDVYLKREVESSEKISNSLFIFFTNLFKQK